MIFASISYLRWGQCLKTCFVTAKQPIQLGPVPQAMAFKYHEEEWPGRPWNCCKTWPLKKNLEFLSIFLRWIACLILISISICRISFLDTKHDSLRSWKHMFFIISIIGCKIWDATPQLCSTQQIMGGIINYQLVEDVNHRHYSTVWLAWLCWHGMLQTKHLAAPAK